jgi:release factor glutamine methyltransferase
MQFLDVIRELVQPTHQAPPTAGRASPRRPGRSPLHATFDDYAVDSDSEHPSQPSVRIRLAPVLAAAAAELARAGVESPRTDAELIAAHVLEVPRGRLLLIDTLRPDERHRFGTLIAERARRVPLQHLLGTAAFRHLELSVGDGVFIPRPETELLAGWGIDRTAPGATVVDLCSGTGAIALSVADESAAARVIAVERSPVALSFLRRNAAGFPSVEVVEGDVTDPDLLEHLTNQVDLVLCNPPYVPVGTAVPPEVADHDPAEAVFGGADGLTVIRPVIGLAATLLKPGGLVGIEHDDRHGDAVPALLRSDGRFTAVTAHPDLAGRPRFATARRT